jgi:hypothetical protein
MGKEVTPEEMKKFISLVSECLKLEEQQRLLNMVTKKITCTHCNQEYSFEVNKGDLEDWENGELIQDVLPYLSPGERELLMSGTCDSCWEKMFGDT